MLRKAWLGCELEGDKCNFRLAQKTWCKKTWCIKHFNLSWLPGWMVADDCGMFPAFSMTYTCSGSSPHIAAVSSLMLSWCTKVAPRGSFAVPKIVSRKIFAAKSPRPHQLARKYQPEFLIQNCALHNSLCWKRPGSKGKLSMLVSKKSTHVMFQIAFFTFSRLKRSLF